MERWTFVEACADAALIVGLLWPVGAQIAQLFSAVPRRFGLVFLAVPALLVGGQFANDGDITYPLAPWNMHTESYTADPRFIDYTVERASGAPDRLLVAQLFPVVGKKLRQRVDETARTVEASGPGEAHAYASASLDAVLASLVREYDRTHAGDPARVIRLWDCTVPVASYAGPDSIRRRLMYEYRPD